MQGDHSLGMYKTVLLWGTVCFVIQYSVFLKRILRGPNHVVCLPLTSVTQGRFPYLSFHVGWVCCWFSPCFEGLSPGSPLFLPPPKTNTSKFEFDLDEGPQVC